MLISYKELTQIMTNRLNVIFDDKQNEKKYDNFKKIRIEPISFQRFLVSLYH